MDRIPRTSYRCNECPREAELFESSGDLIEHMKSEHGCEPEDIELQDITVRKRDENILKKMRALRNKAIEQELCAFLKWGFERNSIGLAMDTNTIGLVRKYIAEVHGE